MSEQTPVALSVGVRIAARVVEDDNGCWIWQGCCHRQSGYGRINVDGVIRQVHRVSYQQFVGPIPEGLEIDHICRVPACCNPGHLRAVKRNENAQNLSGAHADSKTGIRGVSWHSKSRRWFVRVHHLGRSHSGGYFKDIRDAEKAAIALRNDLFSCNDADRSEAA